MPVLALAASQPHYWRALEPLARVGGLPVVPLSTHAVPEGVRTIHPSRAGVFVVASYTDSLAVARYGKPIALAEHGAGQSYVDHPHGAYAGGQGREHISLFLCQTVDIALRNGSRSVVVGYPALDGVRIEAIPGRIGITWHWDCRVTKESGTAFDEYRPLLAGLVEELRRRGYEVVGHAHPRAASRVQPFWRAIGVPWVDYTEFLASETVIVDNSTAGCEAMWFGRRVIWLSASWWRRDVWHGRRFWAWPEACFEVPRPDRLSEIYDFLDAPWDPEPARRVAAESLGQVEGSTRRTLDLLTVWSYRWH